MSQQDIFKKAIAAKLAGDEEGFKAAISEAIKSKAKAMLSEGPMSTGAGFYRNSETGVEQVADNSYLVEGPVNLPEGAVANLPAGQYSFVVDVEPGDDGEQAFATVSMVQVFNFQEDQVLAELHGGEAEMFAQKFFSQEIMWSIESHATDSYSSRREQEDRDNW